MKKPKIKIKTTYWTGNKDEMREKVIQITTYTIGALSIGTAIALIQKQTILTIYNLIALITPLIITISHNKYKKEKAEEDEKKEMEIEEDE